jgi:hypothetical protein
VNICVDSISANGGVRVTLATVIDGCSARRFCTFATQFPQVMPVIERVCMASVGWSESTVEFGLAVDEEVAVRDHLIADF